MVLRCASAWAHERALGSKGYGDNPKKCCKMRIKKKLLDQGLECFGVKVVASRLVGPGWWIVRFTVRAFHGFIIPKL